MQPVRSKVMSNALPTHNFVPEPLNDQNDPRVAWGTAERFLRGRLNEHAFAYHLNAIEIVLDHLQYAKTFEDLVTAYVCQEPGVLGETLFYQAQQEGLYLHDDLVIDAAFDRRYQQILREARWALEMR